MSYPQTTDNISIPFVVFADDGTPTAGLTVGGFTLTLTDPSGGAVTGLAVSAVGGGWYRATKAASWGAAGAYTFKATYTGMQDVFVNVEVATPASTGDPLENTVPGSYASGTAGYVLGNLQDRSVNVVTPFELATAKVTLGFGEDYTSGSTNGLLTIDTTASINLLTAGGTIYFAVRRKNVTINSDPEFTLTGTASDADTFTVSVSNTYTRMLTPGTYLWTAWHVTALGVRTDIGHGNYVIEDLAQPTVS